MKKLLYVCEADSGGIMEYAIRQSAAIAREGVEVYFLCKSIFAVDRLVAGIVVEKFVESHVSSRQRKSLAGKIGERATKLHGGQTTGPQDDGRHNEVNRSGRGFEYELDYRPWLV